jgi:hypothetical protein
VHLALAQVEVDVVVGEDPGELLRDAPHLENRGGFHRGRILWRWRGRRAKEGLTKYRLCRRNALLAGDERYAVKPS